MHLDQVGLISSVLLLLPHTVPFFRKGCYPLRVIMTTVYKWGFSPLFPVSSVKSGKEVVNSSKVLKEQLAWRSAREVVMWPRLDRSLPALSPAALHCRLLCQPPIQLPELVLTAHWSPFAPCPFLPPTLPFNQLPLRSEHPRIAPELWAPRRECHKRDVPNNFDFELWVPYFPEQGRGKEWPEMGLENL